MFFVNVMGSPGGTGGGGYNDPSRVEPVESAKLS